MRRSGSILSTLGLSALVGGMLFFGLVMAPLVFTKLPPDVAGMFIRATFPFYYAFIVVSAALAAVGFLLRGQIYAAVALLVLAGVTLWLWFWFIPYLDALRLAQNMAAFGRGHRLSVWINGAELLTALWLLVRTAV